jgi:outer membrane biosynthesis protein TonB
MTKNLFEKNAFGLSRVVVRLFQAAALALVMTMVMPARAADDRAVKTRVAPIYPEIARRMRISGAVSIEATVAADGSVSSVRKWKFATGTGTAKVNVEVDFAMN